MRQVEMIHLPPRPSIASVLLQALLLQQNDPKQPLLQSPHTEQHLQPRDNIQTVV